MGYNLLEDEATIIVRTCKGLRRENGIMIGFDDNAAVIINKEGNPRGFDSEEKHSKSSSNHGAI